ncbi:hypothetical protein L1D14_07425 [Vibrio tubiashii]|uniref:hypothetical protein n=1 Tax=Vibrio tubiashii TaxID=29498 RepID=UPI001EFCAB5A|nr:hypothetical protein [Vibrio tubiashii]MCG9576068.1 hypothetical protein [Vibrio tubiashii]
MISTVQCFRDDVWEEVDAFELQPGDVFVQSDSTYIAKGPAYKENKQVVIPAEAMPEGPIEINLGGELEFVTMAMDMVCSGAHRFSDGTMIISELIGGNTNVYSPRLPVSELNEFCKQNIDTYTDFYEKHQDRLENGDRIEMKHFWKSNE